MASELRELIKFELSDKTSTDQPPKVDILTFIKQLIDETKNGKRVNPKTKNRFAPDTYKPYQNTLRALERFEKHIRRKINFDTISLEFYNDFKDFMLGTEKISDNYFGLHIKNIKLFMNESLEKGLHDNKKHNHKQFIKLQNETDNIYLNKNQLESLETLDLSTKPKLARVRDLFLVGCWTGLRFSDFNTIAPKDIKGCMIEIETKKTGAKVVIPIHPVVKNIMSRYKDLTENSLPPPISNVKMNEYLKELGRVAKFNDLHQIRKFKGGNKVIKNEMSHELITTHTARRSFATNMYLMGIPAINIMAITGHRTEKAFLKYIKVTSNEHAIKLQEFWERNSMSAL